MSFIAPLPLVPAAVPLSSVRCRACGTKTPPLALTSKPQSSTTSTTKLSSSPRHTSSTRVRALYHKARHAVSEGRFESARALFNQCLELDVHDAHSWLALANLETRIAQKNANASISAARKVFQQGLEHCPESVHLLQAFGVLEHRAGDRDAARRLFALGFEADPDNPYVAQAWGLLEERVGNKKEARRLFAKAVRHRPTTEVLKSWALLEAREGNIERARRLLHDGVQACRKRHQSKSEADMLRQLAKLEESVGDLPKARTLLSQAIAAFPSSEQAYLTLAQLEARRGSTRQALELMRTAAGLTQCPPPCLFVAWAQIHWNYCNDVSAARDVLAQGCELHPRDAVILQTLGNLEHKCGRVERATQLLESSIAAKPTPAAYVALALLEEAQGNIDEAKRLFELALAIDMQHGAAYNAYGMMEARLGNIEAARRVYERGINNSPSASVWHGYGQLELKHGNNLDRACELFRIGTQRAAGDTSFVWHSWGMLELSRKQVGAARDVFAAALKRYPRNSRLLVGAALSAAESRVNENEARAFFKRAVAADPTHAHAWQAWAVFELRFERFDAAEALFQRGLRLCPTHGALWQAWGVLQSELDNHSRARTIFKRGIQATSGHNVHLYQAWACMEVRCGNLTKARQLLDSAIECDRHHGPVWTAYGLLEARHGTKQEARKYFRRGLEMAPDHAPIYRVFGETEVRLGNYNYARKLFEDGLSKDPWHAPLYHAMAKLEGMLGNIGGLAELKVRAEERFGGKDAGARAIDEGGGLVQIDDSEVEVTQDKQYEALRTPMQEALDRGVM